MNRNQKINFIINEKYKYPFIVEIKSRIADPEIEQAANDDLAKLRLEPDEVIDKEYEERLVSANNDIFINALCSNEDLKSWAEEDYWTINEAAWLHVGVNPNSINNSVISEYNEHLLYIQEYLEIKNKLDRAQGAWKLREFCITAKTKPLSFIEWGKDKKRPFPKELEKLVKKQFKLVKETKNTNLTQKDKKRGNGSQTQRQNNNLLLLVNYFAEYIADQKCIPYDYKNYVGMAEELREISGDIIGLSTIKRYLEEGMRIAESRDDTK